MENIPDTPEGIILESLLEGMAEYYSAKLAQKVQRGLRESYLKGYFTGGCQLYGYDVVEKRNVINEEAEIVREVFTKFSQGYTGVDIAKDLKARDVKTKKGVLIDDKKIYKIIANTKYIGKVQHGDTVYTNIYPPIINEITWQKVQDLRKAYKHAQIRKQDSYDYILSGKLFCGYCKHKMVGESGKEIKKVIKYRYYSCLTKRRRKHLNCLMQSNKKDELEKEVMDITWKVLSNNNNLKKIAKRIIKCQSDNEKEARIKALELSRDKLLKASQSLISAVELGIITEQTKVRLKELEMQIAEYDIAIEQEKQKNLSFLTEDMVMEYFKKIICGDFENYEVRKHIVKTFIKQIILYNDAIVIFYNFTDLNYTQSAITNIIDNFDLEKEKQKLLTEQEINKNIVKYVYGVDKTNKQAIPEKKSELKNQIQADEDPKYTPDTGVLGRSQVNTAANGANITKSVEEAVALATKKPQILLSSENIYDTIYKRLIADGMEESEAHMHALMAEDEFLMLVNNR